MEGFNLAALSTPVLYHVHNLILNIIYINILLGYVRYHSIKNNWTEPTPVQFNTAVTNKVTNARKRLNKHPGIKEAKKSGDR